LLRMKKRAVITRLICTIDLLTPILRLRSTDPFTLNGWAKALSLILQSVLSLGFHDFAIATSFDLLANCPSTSPASTMSWESMLPFGIISAMIFVMGTSQFVVHTTIYGKVVCALLWEIRANSGLGTLFDFFV